MIFHGAASFFCAFTISTSYHSLVDATGGVYYAYDPYADTTYNTYYYYEAAQATTNAPSVQPTSDTDSIDMELSSIDLEDNWVTLPLDETCPDCLSLSDHMGLSDSMLQYVDVGMSFNNTLVDLQVTLSSAQFSSTESHDFSTFFKVDCDSFSNPKVSNNECALDSTVGDGCRATHDIKSNPIDTSALPVDEVRLGRCDWAAWNLRDGSEGLNVSMQLETIVVAKAKTGINSTVLYSRWRLSWSFVTSLKLTLSVGATLEVGGGVLKESYAATAEFVECVQTASLCSDNISDASIFTSNTRVCVRIMPGNESLHDVELLNSQIKSADLDGPDAVDLVADYEESWFGVKVLSSPGSAGVKMSFYIPGSMVMDMEDYSSANFLIDFTVAFTDPARRLSGDDKKEAEVGLRRRQLLQLEIPDSLEIQRSTYFAPKTRGDTSIFGVFNITMSDTDDDYFMITQYENQLTTALTRAADVGVWQVEIISVTQVEIVSADNGLIGSLTTEFRIAGLSETSATEVISELTSFAQNGELSLLLTASEVAADDVTVISLEMEDDDNNTEVPYTTSNDGGNDDGDNAFALGSGNLTMVMVAAAIVIMALTAVTYKKRGEKSNGENKLSNKKNIMFDQNKLASMPLTVTVSPVATSEAVSDQSDNVNFKTISIR